jgi:hypothetical protein
MIDDLQVAGSNARACPPNLLTEIAATVLPKRFVAVLPISKNISIPAMIAVA